MEPPVFFLLGPTASGKSELALPLAEALDAEILSLDSMAVYRRMDIGTAKPGPEERARVPHHLVDLVEPWESFDAARYRKEALRVLEEVRRRGKRALFVGGTPFYFQVLTKGLFSGPGADPEVRSRLLEEEEAGGEGTLHRKLARLDPPAAARIHPKDLKRLVRALEVWELSGKPLSSLQREWERSDPVLPYRGVGIRREPEVLKERIRRRTRSMLEKGLVEETRSILEAGGFSRQASAALGYRQVLDFLEGRIEEEELEEAITRRTWRFVRKQRTWFRKFRHVRWLDPDESGDPLKAFLEALREPEP